MSATYSEAYPLHGGWLVIVDGFAAWALDAQEAQRLAARNALLWKKTQRGLRVEPRKLKIVSDNS